MDSHNKAVSDVAGRVKHFYALEKPFRIYHGSTTSTRRSQLRRDEMIDTTLLNRVLHIDTEKQIAVVEPNVPMDQLVAVTTRHGLIPPVVMEFPGITVGGGFAGTAGESSSFKHGLFEHTIQSIEVVLANGDVVRASTTNHPDLFRGIASSFGTLGVVTLLELRLIPSKPFVQLKCVPVGSIEEALSTIRRATELEATDYVDGIMYGPECGIVFEGRLVGTVPHGSRIQAFSRSSDPWFYIHAQDVTSNCRQTVTEYIPLVDYLFRYDRGAFWIGTYAFKYFHTPFNGLTRWLLDNFMHTRVMIHALHKSGLSDQYIAQDVGIPYTKVAEFFRVIDAEFGFYPIWLCPVKVSGNSDNQFTPAVSTGSDDKLINFGVWGPASADKRKFILSNRLIERKVHELGGAKCLYAHTYYTETEFWDIYDRTTYEALRSRYYASYLPSVYDKVKVEVASENWESSKSLISWILGVFWSIWPLGALYGVLHAVKGGDYLLPTQYPSVSNPLRRLDKPKKLS